MARRSRRRRRTRNYLPHAIRLIAIIVIGLVVYRFVAPTNPAASEVSVASDGTTLDLETPPSNTNAPATDIVAASATTAPSKQPSSWTFASLFGFGNAQESETTTTLKPQTELETTKIAANGNATSPTGGVQFQPANGVRNPFSKASNPASVRPIESAAGLRRNAQATPRTPSDGRTAAEILSASRAAYQNISTYSDQGKIALNYRLKGELIAEQQPFSTTWDARNGRYAGKLFSTEIQCDGKLLSCFMYHIDTENFGNQQLVIPVDPAQAAPPIGRVINDPFARNFIAGTENLPLSVPASARQMFALPPALAMLSGQVTTPWLSNSAQLRRKPDQKLQNANCYVLESTPGQSAQNTATVWIDQSNMLVKQIKFPNTLVVSKILSSPDVADIELIASFSGQQINASLPPQPFAVKRIKNANPVTQFVRLPESLVADSIGKSASVAQFIDRDGKRISANEFDAKINTVVWLGDARNLGLVDQLARFKKTLPDSFGFHAVFSGGLADLTTGVPKPVSALRQKERLGIPLLFDDGMAIQSLQLKSMPALLVLGANGDVQFSQNMSDPNWPQSLQSVLQRLSRGEDIAKEMLNNYRDHYQEYGDELERYNANRFFASDAKPVVAKLDRGQRDTSVKLMPNKKWEQKNFALPGNILVLSQRAGQPFGGARYAAFDGNQTVKFIDDRGETTGKITLEIPSSPAITVLRYNSAGDGTFVGFQRMGAQVHVFDSQMQRMRSFPSLEQKHAGILDCQSIPGAAGKFFVSFAGGNGVYLFDANTGDPEKISEQVFSNLATNSGGQSQLIGVADGRLFDLDNRQPINGFADKQFQRLVQSESNSGDYGAIVRSADNAWAAIGLSKQLRQIWSVDLRSQLLENPVEPIAVAQNSDGETFWAVVDDKNKVCLISGRGTWLGDWKSPSAIRGLAISTSGQEVDLIVSTENGVVAWALNYQAR